MWPEMFRKSTLERCLPCWHDMPGRLLDPQVLMQESCSSFESHVFSRLIGEDRECGTKDTCGEPAGQKRASGKRKLLNAIFELMEALWFKGIVDLAVWPKCMTIGRIGSIRVVGEKRPISSGAATTTCAPRASGNWRQRRRRTAGGAIELVGCSMPAWVRTSALCARSTCRKTCRCCELSPSTPSVSKSSTPARRVLDFGAMDRCEVTS